MGLLSVVEDRPTPRQVYNWRVYTCAIIASFASCTIGYDSAFIGTTLALPAFEAEFHFAALSPARLALVKSNIVSVYQAGAFFGALFAYASSFFWGRRATLQLASLVFILGAGLMLGASGERGLGLILGGRVLAGVGVGAASNMVPIYISELAPPAVRGRLVGIYEAGWQIGGLVGFWINYGLANNVDDAQRKQWLIPFAVQLIPAGLLLLGSLWIKESPRWLLAKGRRREALDNLCWIRNLPADDAYIVEEVNLIEFALDEHGAGVADRFWRPFQVVRKSPRIQWRFFLGGMLFLWQNGSGINAINYYSPTVFASIGLAGANASFLTTGIFGVVKTAITFVWLLFLIDTVGRRKMLMIGAAGGSACMWFIGAYIKLANIAGRDASRSDTAGLDSGGIAAIFFFYLWTVFYTPSWNGIPWILNSEMFDARTRSLGQASAAANNWFWNFIISRFTPQMFLAMGYGVYFFFASLMLLSIAFVYFFIPETKGVPLEQMDRLFDIRPCAVANQVVLHGIVQKPGLSLSGDVRDQDEKAEEEKSDASISVREVV